MAELCDRFEAEHLPRKRPSTARDYAHMLHNHIRPHFGLHTKVADVAFADIDRLHRKITAAGTPYAANRVAVLLSKMFALAIRWNMRSDNPCRGVERNYEIKRKRYLRTEELVRLTTALAAYPDRQVANIVRLCLLTGCRKGEAMGMRWADVDLSAGVWSKPGSTTKQKTDHVVPLSAPCLALLSDIRKQYVRQHPKRPLPEWVFPSTASRTGHIIEIKSAWRQLTNAANTKNLRVHDLRHSHASFLVSGGASLALVGAVLGHSTPAASARYAHSHDDPVRAAVERVGAIIENAEKAASDTVVPLKRGGVS